MRLAVVWHGAVVRTGRAFLRELAGMPDVDLTLIAPASWSRYLPRTTRYEPGGEPFRVELFRPWFPAHGATFFSPRIGRLLGAANPDAVLAIEEPFSLIMGQVARWARRASRRPVLACFSYQNIPKQYPFPFSRIERFVYKHIDLLLGANPEVIDVARGKDYAGPAEVLATPVDVEFFAEAAAAESKDRGGTGIRVGYVGRFVEEKGIDTVIEAVERMERPARLVLAGGGPHEDAIRRRAAALGDRVEILPPLAPEEVPRALAGLDVLVLPSRTRPNWKEQFGRVLVEAMASGVAVAGSDSGAIPWVIGDAGRVFPEGDAAELAALLDRLAGDPAERSRLAEAGRKRADDRFRADVVARRLYELLSGSLPPRSR